MYHLIENGIAGRHLQYFKNGQFDFQMFDIKLIDVLDIERALISYERSIDGAGQSSKENELKNLVRYFVRTTELNNFPKMP